jgi:hypothetical protein
MRASLDAAAAREDATKLRSGALLGHLVAHASELTTRDVASALRPLALALLGDDLAEVTRRSDEDPRGPLSRG